jgi:hypothetical protein
MNSADQVRALLDSNGCTEINILPVGDHHYAITFRANPEAAVDLPPAPMDLPVSAADCPPVPSDMGALGGPEIEIALSPADAVSIAAPVEMPPIVIPSVEPVNPFAKECTVMSLNTTCMVPTAFVPEERVSLLKAQHVERMGEFVLFTYCGMSYKYPVEHDAGTVAVCNSPVDFTETSVRLALQFAGSTITYPCLLSVVEGDPCSIVFGKDLEEMVNTEREHIEHDQVSAQ